MVQDINNTTTPDKALKVYGGQISSDGKRKKVGNYIILNHWRR
jgi:hypothetical protein